MTNITIAYSWIDNGDDNIAIKTGVTHMSVLDTTSGDVLIAGLNGDHRTEITLDGVHIEGITPAQVHGHFATVTLGPLNTNIDFTGTSIKVVPNKNTLDQARTPSGEPAFNCQEKFVPMQ